MMNDLIKMNQLKINQVGRIHILNISVHLKQRLMDIGLIEGELVQCVLASPTKNPLAYNIKGAIIAIRNEDCDGVMVKLEGSL